MKSISFEDIYKTLTEEASAEYKFAVNCSAGSSPKSEAIATGILYSLHAVSINCEAGPEIISEIRSMLDHGPI